MKLKIIFLVIFLITGCSYKTKCTYKNELPELYTSSIINKFTFKKDIVKKVHVKQVIDYKEKYLITYNINLKEIKRNHEEMFEKYYSDIPGFKYKISLVKNKLILEIDCQKECLNKYLNVKGKTRDEIIKNYKIDNNYQCE